MKALFEQDLKVVNIGLQGFANNIAAAGGQVTNLSWSPPAGADAALGWTLANMIGDPRIDAGWFLINCDPDTYRRVAAPAGVVPATGELAEIYQRELGRDVADLAWFTALACFKSAATWSLIVKHNRRRRFPRAELEAMAATLPRLLARARSALD